MGRRRPGGRALGPYRDAKGWRYKVVDGGETTWVRCRAGSTEEEAREEVAGARDALSCDGDALTVEEAVEAYLRHVGEVNPSRDTESFERAAARLLVVAHGGLLVGHLRPRHIDQYLAALDRALVPRGKGREATPLAMPTRRSYWKAMQRMTRWWLTKSYTQGDLCAVVLQQRAKTGTHLPWATRAGRKALNRGKPQLRNLDEVETYLTTVLAQPAPEVRVAGSLPLLTGMSSGELRHLAASDVDLRAGVIWVRNDATDEDNEGWSVKTAHRVRQKDIPEVLHADLMALVADREPHEYLFRQKEGNRAHTRTWLRDLVVRMCQLAGVKVVNPHGLRATYSSIQALLGAQSAAQVGQALGHGDKGRTAGMHYIGVPRRSPALQVVLGGQNPKVAGDADVGTNAKVHDPKANS